MDRAASAENRDVAARPPQPAPEPDRPDVARRRRPTWDDAPLRTKLSLLVLLAAVGGCLLGMSDQYTDRTPWLLGVGLTVIFAVVMSLGHGWVVGPIDRLAYQLRRLARFGGPVRLDRLPVERRDEVGELSRAIQQINEQLRRDHHEKRRLRRNIDQRVTKAVQRATMQLERMAMRDALTDLGNRRFLEENLEELVVSVRAANDDLSCIVLDLDNFKQVNDSLGHAEGDELLVLLAALINATTRAEDCAARLGGDEFVVLLPGCTPQRAGECMRQLTALFDQHVRHRFPADLRAGVSAGIASLRRDGARDGRSLLEAADRNLYAAKRAGKGRCVGD